MVLKFLVVSRVFKNAWSVINNVTMLTNEVASYSNSTSSLMLLSSEILCDIWTYKNIKLFLKVVVLCTV